MFVLAAGGDPHRELDHDSVAAERLAGELDTPERRSALGGRPGRARRRGRRAPGGYGGARRAPRRAGARLAQPRARAARGRARRRLIRDGSVWVPGPGLAPLGRLRPRRPRGLPRPRPHRPVRGGDAGGAQHRLTRSGGRPEPPLHCGKARPAAAVSISTPDPKRRVTLPRSLPDGRRVEPYSRADAPYFRSPGFFVRIGGLAVLVGVVDLRPRPARVVDPDPARAVVQVARDASGVPHRRHDRPARRDRRRQGTTARRTRPATSSSSRTQARSDRSTRTAGTRARRASPTCASCRRSRASR